MNFQNEKEIIQSKREDFRSSLRKKQIDQVFSEKRQLLMKSRFEEINERYAEINQYIQEEGDSLTQTIENLDLMKELQDSYQNNQIEQYLELLCNLSSVENHIIEDKIMNFDLIKKIIEISTYLKGKAIELLYWLLANLLACNAQQAIVITRIIAKNDAFLQKLINQMDERFVAQNILRLLKNYFILTQKFPIDINQITQQLVLYIQDPSYDICLSALDFLKLIPDYSLIYHDNRIIMKIFEMLSSYSDEAKQICWRLLVKIDKSLITTNMIKKYLLQFLYEEPRQLGDFLIHLDASLFDEEILNEILSFLQSCFNNYQNFIYLKIVHSIVFIQYFSLSPLFYLKITNVLNEKIKINDASSQSLILQILLRLTELSPDIIDIYSLINIQYVEKLTYSQNNELANLSNQLLNLIHTI